MSAGIYRKAYKLSKPLSKTDVRRDKDHESAFPGGQARQAQEAEGEEWSSVLGRMDREDSRDRVENRSPKDVCASSEQKVLQMKFLLDSIYSLPEAAL